MKMIRPLAVTDANLLATNVAESVDVWLSNVTYAAGTIVRSDATHKLYESLQANNLGHPVTDPAWWLEIGPTNPWAMFDQVNGTQTTNPTDIELSLSFASPVNSLALINLEAESVTISVVEEQQPAYDRTFSLASDSGVSDWYAYFYEEIVRKTLIVALDLPPIAGMEIDVAIRGTDVAVGALVAGSVHTIGETEHGASVGIRDFSRKETDDFGNFMVVERAFSKRGNFKVWCETGRVDAIADVLPRYRATPIVWIAAEAYRSTVIYGFYRDWTLEIAYPTLSVCTLEIEGLS